MMRVVIADDEKISREGLRDVVDWPSLGMEVACCARDGQEALEYIREHPVDILVTDIRMPRMDGLTLLSQLSEQSDAPVSIILSGYSDFHYAQRAIQYGVLSYLLKPIRPSALREALGRAASKRRRQAIGHSDAETYARYKLEARTAAHALAEAMANHICQGEQDAALADCETLRALFLEGGYPSELFKKSAFRCVYQCVHAAESYLGQDIPYFDNMAPMEQLSAAQGYDATYLQLCSCVKDLCAYLREARASRRKHLAGEVVTIIRHRYGDERLSLAAIAEELGVTPNYLSTLFRKHMQGSFSEYLERYRMDRAKALLADMRHKVYEVAAMVGYADAKHFAKVFKANTGQTPQAFRHAKSGEREERTPPEDMA